MRLAHTAVYRKGAMLLRKPQRLFDRLTDKDAGVDGCRGVLCNSFPKSGTHLLLQILQSLPGTRFYGSFLASVPSISFRVRREKDQLNRLSSIAPDEVMPAHLYYSAGVDSQINSQSISHFFVYRDLRDVVVSEAFYLSSMAWWHGLSRYFRGCDSLESRLLLSIEGLPDKFAHEYPDIATRFGFYRPWIESDNCFAIRYEDLRSTEVGQFVRDIAVFDQQRRQCPFDIDSFVRDATQAIDPSRSHTFRSGKKEGWREHFSPRVHDAFDRVAGDLMTRLGYYS